MSARGPGQVRFARAEDLAAIAAIYAHYVEHTYATFDLEAPSSAEWRERWERAGRDGHPWLVCDVDGGLVGYAIASTFNPRPAYRTTVATAIYLAPTAVRRGHGASLYGALLREASARGFHLAVAGVALPNPGSVTLHERLGFVPVGVFREVGHKLGEWRDVGWWQLGLEGRAGTCPTGPPAGWDGVRR